jgi:hypothetical protein
MFVRHSGKSRNLWRSNLFMRIAVATFIVMSLLPLGRNLLFSELNEALTERPFLTCVIRVMDCESFPGSWVNVCTPFSYYKFETYK